MLLDDHTHKHSWLGKTANADVFIIEKIDKEIHGTLILFRACCSKLMEVLNQQDHSNRGPQERPQS